MVKESELLFIEEKVGYSKKKAVARKRAKKYRKKYKKSSFRVTKTSAHYESRKERQGKGYVIWMG